MFYSPVSIRHSHGFSLSADNQTERLTFPPFSLEQHLVEVWADYWNIWLGWLTVLSTQPDYLWFLAPFPAVNCHRCKVYKVLRSDNWDDKIPDPPFFVLSPPQGLEMSQESHHNKMTKLKTRANKISKQRNIAWRRAVKNAAHHVTRLGSSGNDILHTV